MVNFRFYAILNNLVNVYKAKSLKRYSSLQYRSNFILIKNAPSASICKFLLKDRSYMTFKFTMRYKKVNKKTKRK